MAYAIDDVEDAWAITKDFLLPFDLRRWLRLAVIVFFVGGGAGSGGTGWSTNAPMRGGQMPGTFPGGLPLDEPRVLALVVGIGLLILLLIVVLGIVGSVMQFVLVEAVRSGEVRLREPFGRFLGKGLHLFVFQLLLVLGLVVLPMALLVAGLALGAGPVLLLPFVPLLLLVILVAGVTVGLTTDFVVPTMVKRDVGVLAGWRRFWSTLREEWEQYVAYLLVRLVLGIVAGVVVGIVTLVLLLPVLFVAGLLVFGFVTASPSPLLLVPLLLLLIPLGLLALVVSLLVRVPVVTYFRYYSLLVLGDSDPELDLVPERRRRARSEDG